MTDELDAILADLHELGYDSIDRTEGYREASGRVPVPEEYRREQPTGWRRFVPRVVCGGADPDLVPEDLRAVVETQGWTVQPMGHDRETVLVIVSENGV